MIEGKVPTKANRQKSPERRSGFENLQDAKKKSNTAPHASVELGPVLKIDPDAEMLIMGDGNEPQSLSRSNSTKKPASGRNSTTSLFRRGSNSKVNPFPSLLIVIKTTF